jgi:hypothetical protein
MEKELFIAHHPFNRLEEKGFSYDWIIEIAFA